MGGMRLRLEDQDEPQFLPAQYAGPYGKYAFREGWAWSPPVAAYFERAVADLPRPLLHIMSGSSLLGDIRADFFHPAANLKADAFKLPFPDGGAQSIVCDPPYNLTLQDRFKLGMELARVLPPLGRIVFKAPWPLPEGKFLVDDRSPIVLSLRVGMLRDAHLIWFATRRIPGPKAGKGMLKASQRRARDESAGRPA